MIRGIVGHNWTRAKPIEVCRWSGIKEAERPFQAATKTRLIKKPVIGKPFVTELRIVGNDAGINYAMESISKSFFGELSSCPFEHHLVTVAPPYAHLVPQ